MSRHGAPHWPVWIVLLLSVAFVSVPMPDVLTPFRPPWAAIAMIYWIMMWPRVFGVGSAWIVGLLLDILQGDLLGQNALAMSVIGYLTLRFHLQIRIFPLWQLTSTVFALLLIDALIQVVIEGYAGAPVGGLQRWTPVIGGTLVWPVVMAVMDRLRLQLESRGVSFI